MQRAGFRIFPNIVFTLGHYILSAETPVKMEKESPWETPVVSVMKSYDDVKRYAGMDGNTHAFAHSAAEKL